MNRYRFAALNVLDKLRKVARNRGMAEFYFRTYVLSRLDREVPAAQVVSYPKCGRTWVRMWLNHYANLAGTRPRSYNDRNLVQVTDDILVRFEHGQGSWVPAPPPLDSLAFDHAAFDGKRVVFLVRDPRDVLVSSWYHLHYREHIYAGDLSTFIRDDLVGVRKVVRFMNMWLEHSDACGAFLLLRYEQLHAEPHACLEQLLRFMHIDPAPSLIERAVADSRFERMKQAELSGSLKEPWMRPGSADLVRSLKVRKGKIGGFREELSAQDIEFLDREIAASLTPALPYREPSLSRKP